MQISPHRSADRQIGKSGRVGDELATMILNVNAHVGVLHEWIMLGDLAACCRAIPALKNPKLNGV